MRSKASSRRLAAALGAAVIFGAGLIASQSSPAVALDAELVTFDGAGWGHGVGMSQYGAQAMATDASDPRTYDEILGYYYTGSSLGSVGAGGVPDPGDVYVSASSDQTKRTVRVLDGPGTSSAAVVVSRGAGATLQQKELTAGASFTVIDTKPQANGGCSVSFSDGTTWAAETAEGISLSCDITVPLSPDSALPSYLVALDSCRTTDCTFAWGTALLLVDNGSDLRSTPDKVCPGDCPLWPGFDAVVRLPLDTYTRGIAEMPYSWHPEALKAQAVAARSYAARAAIRADHDHADAGCFCDLKNSSASQVYAGWIGSRDRWQQWDAAAVATGGQIVVHPSAPDGTIVDAVYGSSSGGATESSEDKWGTSRSYLSSVPDAWSLTTLNPYRAWTATTSRATLSSWLGMADVTDVSVVERNESGSPRVFHFEGVNASGAAVAANRLVGDIQARFGLRSWYFDIVIPDRQPEPPPTTTAPPTTTTLPPIVFTDIDDTIHRFDIEYLAGRGFAVACDAGDDRFCPDERMRREDMAAFIARALQLPPAGEDYFVDDDGLPYEDDINRIAAIGITKGCNPPANTEFCPDDTVTRGQMAAFLVRAWSLTNAGPGDWFTDDDRSIFEGDIDRLATAGITKGCNPPANTKYCPESLVTRAQSASFLARALRSLGP